MDDFVDELYALPEDSQEFKDKKKEWDIYVKEIIEITTKISKFQKKRYS